MRIVLLSAPFVPEYMRNARCDFVSLSATQWYPLWLGYCGAFLEGKGHRVELVDAPASGLDHAATRRLVRELGPDFLVVYTGLKSRYNDVEFADSLVDELGVDAAFVGPYASIDPADILRRSARVSLVVEGEFEKPILDLVEGRRPEEIGNLWYRRGEEIHRNPPRPYLDATELDSIPFVSRFFKEHLDLRRYNTISEYYPFMDLMTGRGCQWGHCTYCLWVHSFITGPTYNCRSVENVVEEFRYIERELPEVRSVMIQDDTFTEERAVAFAEAKIEAGLRIPWSCYARGNMGYEALSLMKRSGCRNLHVGYESADRQVLKNIRKGLSREQMTRFTENAKRAGLRIHGDFAFGFPGETLESARETIRLAIELNPHTAQFQLMIPFPGTPFYDLLRKNGWLTPEGEPDYPEFGNEDIRRVAKEAYRSFYLSPQYALKCLRHPHEHLFGRAKAVSRAIPAMFWRRW